MAQHSGGDPGQERQVKPGELANVRLWLGAEVRAPAWRLPLLGGKQTFVLDVRFSADYVRFSPKSGRIDTVTVESARDPIRTCGLGLADTMGSHFRLPGPQEYIRVPSGRLQPHRLAPQPGVNGAGD